MISQLKNSIKQYLVPRAKWVILNFHQVGEKLDPKVHNRHIWNELGFFRRQMNYLQQNFQIVSMREGFQAIKEGSIKNTLISLSFDDGDVSIASLVMPLLEKMGIPATFFINTAYGKEKMGYWYNLGPYFDDQEMMVATKEIRNTDQPTTYRKLLTVEDKLNRNHSGKGSPFYSDYKIFETCTNPLFHFGLHGHEHLRFSMLDYNAQKENLKKNIQAMSHWPHYVPYFAVPFGQPQDWNIDTLTVAKELNLIPFLAYQGYNTEYRLPFLRTSVDGLELSRVFKNLSPFQKTYYQLNKLPAR